MFLSWWNQGTNIFWCYSKEKEAKRRRRKKSACFGSYNDQIIVFLFPSNAWVISLYVGESKFTVATVFCKSYFDEDTTTNISRSHTKLRHTIPRVSQMFRPGHPLIGLRNGRSRLVQAQHSVNMLGPRGIFQTDITKRPIELTSVWVNNRNPAG